MAENEKKKPVKTSLVLPYELHWGMKRHATQREMGDTAAVREAIQHWISRTPLHALLDQILATGSASALRDAQMALVGVLKQHTKAPPGAAGTSRSRAASRPATGI